MLLDKRFKTGDKVIMNRNVLLNIIDDLESHEYDDMETEEETYSIGIRPLRILANTTGKFTIASTGREDNYGSEGAWAYRIQPDNPLDLVWWNRESIWVYEHWLAEVWRSKNEEFE